MIKIYCDTGGYHNILKKYENVIIYNFEYENKNMKVNNKGLPSSNMTWDDFKNSPAKLNELKFDDFYSSNILNDIIKIIGIQNKIDAYHLDSAYKNNCDIFLTSDNDDIYSKKELLEPLLSIKIFLPHKNLKDLEEYLNILEKI